MIKKKLIILSFFFIPFILVNKIKLENLFIGDSLIKLLQANSLIENNFSTDAVQCKLLGDLGNCKFLLDGFYEQNNKVIGPFPVYLTFVMAIILKLFSPKIIVWFSIFLFLATLLLFYLIWKSELITFATLFLATPLFFHSISFIDFALSLFFLLIGLNFLFRAENISCFRLSLAGFSLGVSILFRPEIMIFVGILFFLILLSSKKNGLVWLVSFFLVPVIFFFISNQILYSNFLGSRVSANSGGILNLDLGYRLEIVKSLLFFGDGRIGFFGYMPVILLILFWVPFAKPDLIKNFDEVSILYFTTIGSIFLICLLSPNNSNIDWGSRYLSFLVIPIALIFDKFIYKNIMEMDGIRKKIFFGVSIISLLFSINISRKYYNHIVEISQKTTELKQFFTKQNSEIWVFTNNYVLNFAGTALIEKPVLFLKKETDVGELVNYLNSQKKYSTISFFQVNPIIGSQKGTIFTSQKELEDKLLLGLSKNFQEVSKDMTLLMNSFTFKIEFKE